MKIKISIFFLAILVMLSPAYAWKGNDNLGYSPISKVKVQILQNLGDQYQPLDQKSFSFSNNSILSDQMKYYKYRKKAFFRSLILPGAGEYYVGNRTLAKTFFFTEIALWLSYFSFRKYGKWVREDALAFAATHSAANIEGKPSQFFVDIGNYIDVYQYNDAKQRFFQFEKVYADDDYFWSWDSNNNRRKFENMRIASDRAFNRSIFVLGGIFANHLISAINSVWQTHRYNKKLDQMSDAGINFYVGSDYTTGKITLTIQKKF
jgi:hypothetical protein